MNHHARLRMLPWHKAALVVTGVWLLITGIAWLAVHCLWGAGSGPDALPSPTEAQWMRLHGLGVFAGLFVSGALAGGHVAAGWRHTRGGYRRGRRLGGVALSLGLLLLAATGYALYYLLPENWRDPVGWVHAGLGVAVALGVLWHARARAYTGGQSSSRHPTPPRV